jgi:hypothetical protein
MKTERKTCNVSIMVTVFFLALTGSVAISSGQNMKKLQEKYLTTLPSFPVTNQIQKYRMTAVYTNRDLYGNFTAKTKVSGDYTRGLGQSRVKWENVSIASSNQYSGPFPSGEKQEYMENMEYVPSADMLSKDAFKGFPETPAGVLAKNLVWDMMSLEEFAWGYTDSLKLNISYQIPDKTGKFAMADIGTYEHTGIQLCWTGITSLNGEWCAVIEFRAIDNKLALSMPVFTSKGTEQYWGTIRLSLHTKLIESAVMYSGTIQELNITNLPNKLVIKTIRELWVDKIQ